MKVGIFGGSFDPCHNGHVNAALTFRDRTGLDRLYIVPAFMSPWKQSGAKASPVDRMKMLELSFMNVSGYGKTLLISDYELSKGGRSYTIDTVRHFAPEGDIYLLSGTDTFLTLMSWNHWQELLRECTPVVINRYSDEDVTQELEKYASEIEKKTGTKPQILRETTIIGESSASIRESVRTGESIAARVPGGVSEYISERRLYI